MAIELNVYVTVFGLLLWSIASIAWAVWKNRQENAEHRKGMGFFDKEM